MLKKSRIAVLVVLVFSVLSFYVYKLMDFQVSQGETFRANSTKSTLDKINIIAPRGQILDRYGRVLATNTVGYNIIIERAFFPSSRTDKERNQQDQVILNLADMVTQDGGTWQESLPISKTAPYTFTGTAKQTQSLIKDINKNLKGKKDPDIKTTATADDVMTYLKKIYKTSGYSEDKQRILCGVRYEMYRSGFSTTNVFTFAQNVSAGTVTKIEERSTALPGAVTQQVPIRNYPDGTIAPHVIGLTGLISSNDLDAYTKKGYSPDDTVGTFGVEKSMEQYLHGTNGVEQVEVTNTGNIASTTVINQPKPGDNVVLTIDKDLQVMLQNQLPQIVQYVKALAAGDPRYGAQIKGATSVVMDIKTGEVLAMATYPSFDLNTYRQNFSQLNSDKLNPLLNRCISGQYRPGSTFKPLVAAAGLTDGIITPTTKWDVQSEFDEYASPIPGRGYVGSDDNHEPHYGLDVQNALAISSNVFFNTVGDKLGMKALEDFAVNVFGIGKKTGIELDSEKAGSMTGYAYAKDHGITVHPADAAQAAIGQLNDQLTPLQLVNYLSTLLRNGTQYQVHVVKQVNSYDNSNMVVDNNTPKVISKTDISQAAVNAIKQGMLSVTEGDNGTAKSVFDSFTGMKVGGKTGTAQIGSLSNNNPNVRFNGLFISFAPYDDPEIAVCVVVENGHNGYQIAPVAREAIQQYFNLNDAGFPNVSPIQAKGTGSLIQ